jgi:hypothetical protein
MTNIPQLNCSRDATQPHLSIPKAIWIWCWNVMVRWWWSTGIRNSEAHTIVVVNAGNSPVFWIAETYNILEFGYTERLHSAIARS